MDADALVSKWVKSKLPNGWAHKHEDKYGCTVTVSNVRFDTASEGCCSSCYFEYPAIMFEVSCSCPTKIPSTRNPEKLVGNKNRITRHQSDIRCDLGENGFSLPMILAEMKELDD